MIACSFHHELLWTRLLWSAALCSGNYQLPIIKILTEPQSEWMRLIIYGSICANLTPFSFSSHASSEAGMKSQILFAVWFLMSGGETLLLDLEQPDPLTWKKKLQWIFPWARLLIGMKIITSAVWVTQGITSKATARQGCMQALGFHTWKRLRMLSHAESCFKEMHYSLVACGICFVYFSESYKKLPTSN